MPDPAVHPRPLDHLPAAPTTPTSAEGCSRREVLHTAGLVALSGGAVLTLAACAAEGQAGDPAPTSAAPDGASSAIDASVATADVPVGGGVILGNADCVVTQPTRGTFKAFSKTCTHQGCKVTTIANGSIQCPCHGSQFSITDGAVVHPPATRPLPQLKTSVSGGKVHVTG